ncbi:hypothetical protein J8L98_13005, partial [Pseudoalteromonas sp. MMG013]|uniref:FimV/HubP family polar landmark protein n=1 Tax=Pseudoalteromonas sp. MMG013 TaxID=2822687 RepID=UPI001B4A2083
MDAMADEPASDVAESDKPEPDLAQALEPESDDVSDDASAETHHEVLDDTLGEFDEQAEKVDEPVNDVAESVESDLTQALESEAIQPSNLADAPEFEFEEEDSGSTDDVEKTVSPDEFLSNLDTLSAEEENTEQLEIDEAAIESEFMSNLSDTDFDALLNDLSEPDSVNIDDLDDVEVDFESLLSDELETELNETDTASVSEEHEVEEEDQFVNIDDLLSQSDDLEPSEEPYNEADMDVGLGDFDEFLAGDNATDVDLEADGFSAKLDLARAYIEIEDYDGAMGVIQEVLENGPESVQREAQALQSKLEH